MEPTSNRESDRAELAELIGDEVCVAVSIHGVLRSGHYTQMSIHGTLEAHPEDNDSFRVVRDKRTYTYFTTEDVLAVNPWTTGLTTIHIQIDQSEDKE